MNPRPPTPNDAPAAGRQRLSCLLDGDATADDAAQLCGRWRQDPELRSTWHAYHLIGDAMRSDELAAPPARDASFLAGLRERLAREPVIVAPLPPQKSAAVRAVPRWSTPAAVVAGFALVAGALVVTRLSAPIGEPGGPLLAQQQLATAGVQPVATTSVAATSAASPADPADAGLIRDARIDRYFEAHRGMRASPAAALPGGALRNVDMLMPPR